MFWRISIYNSPKCGLFRFIASYLIQRFHCGEQQYVTNGVAAGEHHYAAVDAHAHAARGRHPVLESQQEILASKHSSV